MENKSLHKLGIDIGSTTVKVAVLDEQDNLLFSDYERHFANIQETLTSLIQKYSGCPGRYSLFSHTLNDLPLINLSPAS